MLSSSSQRGPQAHQDQHHKERWFLLHFRTWIPWGSGKWRLMLLGSKWWPQESLGAKVPLQQCCWHTGGNQGRKTLLNDVLISTSTQCYRRNKTSVSQQEARFPWGRSDQALLQSPQVQREAPQPRWLHAARGAELGQAAQGKSRALGGEFGNPGLCQREITVVLLHWDVQNSIWHKCWKRKINTHITVLQKLQAFELYSIYSSWLSSNAQLWSPL